VQLSAEQLSQLAETMLSFGARAMEVTPLGKGGVRLEIKPEPYLTLRQASEHLCMSEALIRRLVRERKLSCTRKPGNRGDMLFRPDQLRRDMRRMETLATGGL